MAGVTPRECRSGARGAAAAGAGAGGLRATRARCAVSPARPLRAGARGATAACAGDAPRQCVDTAPLPLHTPGGAKPAGERSAAVRARWRRAVRLIALEAAKQRQAAAAAAAAASGGGDNGGARDGAVDRQEAASLFGAFGANSAPSILQG